MYQYPDWKPLDELDREIVKTLQSDGRISNVELARRVRLSPPAVHARIRRLEEQGFIRCYRAIIEREHLGFDLLCFVQVGLHVHSPEQIEEIRTTIAEMPEVLECHHVTGEYDYLLKLVVRNRKELEQFIMNRLAPVTGLARINTSLVLNEIKNTTEIPVEPGLGIDV